MDLSFESIETPALTKAQLAELLFDQIGLNKRESKDMIDAFFELISKKLVSLVATIFSNIFDRVLTREIGL